MIFILYGYSEIGAHVGSNLCYLIGLRHLIRTRAVTNQFFSPEKRILSFCNAAPDPVMKSVKNQIRILILSLKTIRIRITVKKE